MPELSKLFSVETLFLLFEQLGHAIAILAGAYLLTKIINKWVPRLRAHLVQGMMRHAGGSPTELEKRAATLGAILRKSISAVVWTVASIMALKEVGFDIGPILAGAGVVGLAVGFGAQNLVQDLLAGMFMLLENQIRVQDVVIVNGTSGFVEEINLRTTVLRGLDGTVHVFPNGQITSLSNMTREYSYYLFKIGVAYKEDTDHVVEVVKEIADHMMREEQYAPDILEPLEVLGVDEFADSAVIIKARIKTVPIKQWMIGREMNRRIKKKFDELGIEIPFPHQTLYFGEASKAFRLQLDQTDREEIKGLVQEVLEERAGKGPSASV